MDGSSAMKGVGSWVARNMINVTKWLDIHSDVFQTNDKFRGIPSFMIGYDPYTVEDSI